MRKGSKKGKANRVGGKYRKGREWERRWDIGREESIKRVKKGSREKGRSMLEGGGGVGKWRDRQQNGEGEGAEVGKDFKEGHSINRK